MPLFDLSMGVLSVKNRTRIPAIPVKNQVVIRVYSDLCL